MSLTTFVYVSPVQTIPLCDQTGIPTIPFDGFRSMVRCGEQMSDHERCVKHYHSRRAGPSHAKTHRGASIAEPTRVRISSVAARMVLASVSLSLVLPMFACGSNPVAPAPVTPSAATFTVSTLSFTSDPQDFVGQGQSPVYTLQNAAFLQYVARSGGFISVAVQPKDEPPSAQWSLIIMAPTGQLITPGSYDTMRLSTNSTYGLDFVGNMHGCNNEAGHMVIHSVEVGPDLMGLKHFRVSFENHCDGRSAALRGEVAVLADPWR